MATVGEGGLFPPQIQSYLPAFVIKNPAQGEPFISINYNTSDYNNLSDIKSVHVSITRQSNYKSLFDNVHYIRGVYVVNHTPASQNDTIDIPLSVINTNELNYNEYYKVQIRLSKITCNVNPMSNPTALSEYLLNEANLIEFSEWSTVCLIRFISQPVIILKGNGHTFSSLNTNDIHTSNLTIYGTYNKHTESLPTPPFPSTIINGRKDKEYLASYKIQILTTGEELIFDSGDINGDRENPNQFNYNIPYYFNANQTVFVDLIYTTANLFTETIRYTVRAVYSSSSWASQNIVEEVTAIDSVIGKINVCFMPKDTETPAPVPANSTLTIRRGCDKDGFTIWDTIWKKRLTSPLTTTLSFDDFTIESGNLYKYEITYTDTSNHNYTIVEGPVMSIFDHAFLTGEGTQLCVKFNPNISSYRINVSDNIINTIGGKYPFIQRNGDMRYRSFILNGTIAYEMDEQHQFKSRTQMYGEWIDVYGSYFVNHYFNQRNDRITQRKFREAVMDYFYDDMPKLFRSTPEGNILVTITDVSLTPNQQLSRMIYDFTCTVTEIGEASIENCKLYNIQDFGEA